MPDSPTNPMSNPDPVGKSGMIAPLDRDFRRTLDEIRAMILDYRSKIATCPYCEFCRAEMGRLMGLLPPDPIYLTRELAIAMQSRESLKDEEKGSTGLSGGIR